MKRYKMNFIYEKLKFYPVISKTKTHYVIEVGSVPISCAKGGYFTLHDIVKYNHDYWKVILNNDSDDPTKYTPGFSDGSIVYRIRLLVDILVIDEYSEEKNRTSVVEGKALLSLTKKDAEIVRNITYHLNKYNLSIFNLSESGIKRDRYESSTSVEFLAKKSERKWSDMNFESEYPPILQTIPFIFDLYISVGIRIHALQTLGHIIKQTKRSDLQVHLVPLHPFAFITEEYQLFDFDKADKIADRYHIDTPDDERLRAWMFSLVHCTNSFYVEEPKLLLLLEQQKYKIFKKSKRYLFSSDILKLISIGQKNYYSTEYLMNKEKKLGDRMLDLFYEKDSGLGLSREAIRDYISEYEREKTFILNSQQREAVIKGLMNKFAIMTGHPGTGKTTIMLCIFWILGKIGKYNNISISAPTGLAFKNIWEKTGEINIGGFTQKLSSHCSGTIHKVIFNDFPRILQYDEEFELKPKLIVVDEVSMLDIYMFYYLIRYCKLFECQLILIGDNNQLPSIGPGSILNSLIQSPAFVDNTATLTHICRQEKGKLLSGILKMAQGGLLTNKDFDNETFPFHPISNFKNGSMIDETSLIDLLESRHFTPENSKVLCYNTSSKMDVNTVQLNKILQCKYNSEGKIIPRPIWGDTFFRIHDRVILTKNQVQEQTNGTNVYRVNGDEGVILRYDEITQMVLIKYLKDTIPTEMSVFKLYDVFQLSYALSVHKSQGSQYDNILFIIDNIYNLSREVVFTGISRAKQQCILLARPNEFLQVQTKTETKPSIFMKQFITYEDM